MWPFRKYTTIEIGDKKYRRPLATQNEIETVEKAVFERCNPFLSKIKDYQDCLVLGLVVYSYSITNVKNEIV